MKYKLVALDEFTGNKATVYSLLIVEEGKTFFEKFIEENYILFEDEIFSIVTRLELIGKKTGARENFFKLYEGDLGDGVVALYDEPEANLRLYCIRYGTQIVILGGGGHKPKNIRAFQENIKLENENYLLRKISKEITERIKEKRITYSPDGYYFEGELEFDDENYE